ncbi:MAG: Trk family potassium uptake protein [Bacilli bacterium]|nr:Trk family potassium uptake protein [Bacilli bacterium]
MFKMKGIKKYFGYGQILVIGFAIIILLGTFLLSLPIASNSGEWTPFLESLFTATSCTCVTGLVVHDTAEYFSIFGQIVILCLIQIGGLGFFSIIVIFRMIFQRKMTTRDRQLLAQASGYFRIADVVKMTGFIIIGTLIVEFIGAAILSIRYVSQFGGIGIWYAIFTSISAFCNAGFDLNGVNYGAYSSMTAYSGDALVLITLSILIILGGIGFIVWDDVIKNRWHFKEYSFHSKLALTTTFILIVVGTGLYLLFEFNNPLTIKDMSVGNKILNAFFQSVTTRTAGFNAIEQGGLKESSLVLTLILMIIGGSPASTAGGIKTTTIAILVLNAVAAARNKNEVTSYKRRFDDKVIKQASAIGMIYLSLIILSLLIIMPSLESKGFNFRSGIYAVFSAIGTVGLAHDVTAEFSVIAQIVLIILMYTGRIGGLTVALFFSETHIDVKKERPVGDALIG